jgi:hypothetical protein
MKRKDQDLEARQRRGNPKENPPNTKKPKKSNRQRFKMCRRTSWQPIPKEVALHL